MTHADTAASLQEPSLRPTGTLRDVAKETVVLASVRPYGEGDPVDVVIRDGLIAAIGRGAAQEVSGEHTLIDGRGHVLLPGLVDMHVHLREPGREDAETIVTGSQAAAKGGFTAVFTMANTSPVTDDPAIAESVWDKGQRAGLCDVHPVGSITRGLEGRELTDHAALVNSAAQVRMFSDDGKCVNDPQLMREALESARGLGVLIAQHAEEHRMTEGSSANEGAHAEQAGLKGWPRVAEEAIVIRDALLARDYGNRVHICHASTAGTVELLTWAKGQGIPITAEVTPHHLLLTDAKVLTRDGLYRVNPPLREESDRVAVRKALLDGVIDCVATDHAPHGSADKCVDFPDAKPGMIGLETSLAIVADTFVATGLADWRWVAKVMSERPAQITGLPGHGRPIAVGEPANLTIVDPGHTWTAHGEQMASKASNTPYEGMEFGAQVTTTVLHGRITCADGRVAEPFAEPAAEPSAEN